MSGHSHWSGIKYRKGINDAKRTGIFTKLGRAITLAARENGRNQDFNFKLKLAIDQNAKIDYEKLLGLLDDQEDIQEVYDNL